MDGRTHAALGAATALVVIRPTKPEDLIATAAVGAFAGILPDVDISGSKVSRVIRSIIGGFISIVPPRCRGIFMMYVFIFGWQEFLYYSCICLFRVL